MVELFTEECHEYIKKLKEYDKEHPEEVKEMRKIWWENESKSFIEGIKKQLENQEKNAK